MGEKYSKMKGFLWVKLYDLAFKMNKTGYFHFKQGHIIISYTFMVHICTFNIKIGQNLSKLVTFIGIF